VDFQLSDDQRAIRDLVRDLARNENAPNPPQWDEDQHSPRMLLAAYEQTHG